LKQQAKHDARGAAFLQPSASSCPSISHPPNNKQQPDIRKAYLRLAVQLHPDKNPGDEVRNERERERECFAWSLLFSTTLARFF
jgi:hypothetical protein